MRVVYLLPILPPKAPRAEALSQEIALLQTRFPGDVVFVNPNAHLSRPLIPRLAFGLAQLPRLRRLGREADLYHFFNPDPFPFPFLLALPRPVVYTVTSGIDPGQRARPAFFRRMAQVAAPDERSLAALRAWGLENCRLQSPGIDTSRFTVHPQPLAPGEPCRILVASAPWTAAQFASKGFTALLEAAREMPELHLTLLWRGVERGTIDRRVDSMGLRDRVCIIDETVDVNQALTGVHAAALFAARPGLVKSYPHSLLDALAAGKPVLLSRAIPMSDYVAENGCGVVIETVTPEAIEQGIRKLRAGYTGLAQAAAAVGPRDFAAETALDAVGEIYAAAQAHSTRPKPVA